MSGSDSGGSSEGRVQVGAALPILLLGAMVLFVFGDLLIGSDGIMASHRIGDAAKYFVFAREFGAEELSNFNLPLWNPHVFSGTPFVGVFQSSVLYPLNFFYLFLPIATAINLELALHVFLLATFSFLWARGRGLGSAGALVTATIAAFGASAWMRVLAGQLTVLDSFVWVPLLLLCVDRLEERVTAGWTLVVGFSGALMILAGHPPTVFMSAVAIGLYSLLALQRTSHRSSFVGALAAAGLMAGSLSALQLALGFEMARESIRSGGMSLDFVTSFSFPPENLLTLIVPQLFGSASATTVNYFGRWFYWDDLAYVGVTGLLLGGAGIWFAYRDDRSQLSLLSIIAGLVILALGRYTPVYAWLHAVIPGFDLARSPSKFMFFAVLFFALFAGLGADRLCELHLRAIDQREWKGLRLAVLAIVLLLCVTAIWIEVARPATTGADSPIGWLAGINDRRITPFSEANFDRWSNIAVRSLLVSAGVGILLAGLLFVARTRRWAAIGVAALCLLELLSFARSQRGGVAWDIRAREHPAALDAYENSGEQRVLDDPASNLAMATRSFGIWGYDPMILSRYAEYLARSQDRPVKSLNNIGGRSPSRYDSLLANLRLRTVVGRSGRVSNYEDASPRFLLVGRHEVSKDREAIFDRLASPEFDFRQTVILESSPDPLPSGVAVSGRVRVLGESTDEIYLDVVLEAPAILVITDTWARGWKAESLEGSTQSGYVVQPANGVMRGIALGAGHHHLKVEYRPSAYTAGLWVSTISWGVALAGVLIGWVRRRSAIRLGRTTG